MTVTKVKEGGLFRQRILGDLLRTPSQQPQVFFGTFLMAFNTFIILNV